LVPARFDTSGGTETVTATPAVNDLIVVVVHQSNTSNPVITVTDSNSDGNGTYTEGPHGWNAATDRTGGYAAPITRYRIHNFRSYLQRSR
jgi:hypothetical protein